VSDKDNSESPSSRNIEESHGFWTRIWRYFLSGVLVSAPLGVTLYIVWAVVITIDEKVKQLLPGKTYIDQVLPYDIPGWGLIIGFVVFTLIGAFTRGFIGHYFVRLGDHLLHKTPLVRGLYSAIKQIIEAVFKRDKTSFREVVLLEYPRKGIWTLGFVTGIMKGEIRERFSEEMVNVFVPTTPNPTSGFFLFVRRKDLEVLSMSVEEGIKMVVSMGIIGPSHNKKVRATERTKEES
jgi:uncharacterized membrane protein